MGFPVSSNIPVTILDEQGQAVPHRNNVKIVGAELTDSAVNDETTITVDTNPDKGWYLEDVKDFDVATVTNVASATITWEDPDDIVFGGVTQADWAGTKIVRKEGSIPQSASDGVVVVDGKVKDQYKIVGYVDSSISLEHTYYYRAFPYTERGQVTSGSYKEVYIERVYIYGAEWDGTSSPAWVRTDKAVNFVDPVPQMSDGNGGWTQGSSPFDTISPWKDIRVVTDADCGELVEIPKFYYKWTRTGSKMKLQISPTQAPGFIISPAHADRGDGEGERNVVYVGRYHCAVSTYKSSSNALPANNINTTDFRQAIHELNTDAWMMDFAMWWTVSMLFLVEFANWNSQEKIGYGCSDTGSDADNSGATDAMTYHTGTTKTDRTTYGHTQYRYIEDWWGTINTFCTGIYFAAEKIYIIKNPADFSDDTGGTYVGDRSLVTARNVKEWTDPSNISGYEYALFPSKSTDAADMSTYNCDGYYVGSRGAVLSVGGSWNHFQHWGAFTMSCDGDYPRVGNNYGTRLMKLPS